MVYREKRSDGTVRLTGGGLQAYPVGSIYFSDRNTDPATLFGGTWERFAQGRMLVGLDETDPDFDTVLETGGEKEHDLLASELPGHEHTSGTLVTNTGTAHDHTAGSLTVSQRSAAGSAGGAVRGNSTIVGDAQVNGTTGTSGGAHTHVISGNTGGVVGANGDPHENMSPYIVVYIWRRTA